MYLARKQRLIAACGETACVQRQSGRVTQGRDDGRLFDDHRHEVVTPVNDKVRRDRERQAEHTDDIFDHPIRRRRSQDMPALQQQLRVRFRQPAALLQFIDALGDCLPIQPANA